jgi:hypothetical protein
VVRNAGYNGFEQKMKAWKQRHRSISLGMFCDLASGAGNAETMLNPRDELGV